MEYHSLIHEVFDDDEFHVMYSTGASIKADYFPNADHAKDEKKQKKYAYINVYRVVQLDRQFVTLRLESALNPKRRLKGFGNKVRAVTKMRHLTVLDFIEIYREKKFEKNVYYDMKNVVILVSVDGNDTQALCDFTLSVAGNGKYEAGILAINATLRRLGLRGVVDESKVERDTEDRKILGAARRKFKNLRALPKLRREKEKFVRKNKKAIKGLLTEFMESILEEALSVIVSDDKDKVYAKLKDKKL